MADIEFEEFGNELTTRKFLNVPFYSLVPDLIEDLNIVLQSSTATLSDEDDNGADNDDDDDINDNESETINCDSNKFANLLSNVEKTNRKLPEIPKNKTPINIKSILNNNDSSTTITTSITTTATTTEPDSGNSSAYSSINYLPINVVSTKISLSPATALDTLEATHRGINKFVPRHTDEIAIELGDPVYVQKECDDHWCEGINLRTGLCGVFPAVYVIDREYDIETSGGEFFGIRERYCLGYLGSVETFLHKGTAVVCQAIKRILQKRDTDTKPHSCILEISDRGLRMVDRNLNQSDEPCIDYFYSLKNVSFCAFDPYDHRFFGFITKHPILNRFACHVFQGVSSTRDVAEAIGRAFQRFYRKYVEEAYPVEDIYIE